MKNITQKLFLFIAIILFALFITACGGNTYAEPNDLQAQNEELQKRIEELENEKNHTAAPVCEVETIDFMTEPETTTEIPTEAPTEPPTTTEEPTPEPTEPPKAGDWVIRYYVDEFKQPTNEGYVHNNHYFEGIFSNSATTDSELKVVFLVDKENLCIQLYEYGKYMVKTSLSRKYDIIIKSPNDNKYNLTGTLYNDRIKIDDKYKSDVITALSENENVTFYIVQSEQRTTNYLFDVPTSNFAYAYQSLVNQ